MPVIETQLQADQKGLASVTLGDVIRQTARNFPDPRFHPKIYAETDHYTIAGIDLAPYQFWVTADGVGTKPELAERLYTESLQHGGDPAFFESLAFDTFAMIDGDEARWGRFLVGVANVLDMNSAHQDVVAALARGAKQACDAGRFALLNGETAELGYRTSGYGKTRVNWNATGISIIVPEKMILGERLAPGQPVVGFRETSIRSNGLSKARAIMEALFLQESGFHSKKEYVQEWMASHGFQGAIEQLDELFGHDAVEQILLPWHQAFPEVTAQVLAPSRLYGPIIYDAQGGVDGERQVDMIAAAHVTGGGVPEKGKRMVDAKGLGLTLYPEFPDPVAVTSLLAMTERLLPATQERLDVTDQTACEQWNRGVGFMVVVADQANADRLIEIAAAHACDAAVMGEVTDQPQIEWRGYTWRY